MLVVAAILAAAGVAACGGSNETDAMPLDPPRVTVESADGTTVVLFWTTSAPSEGEVLYGANRDRLDGRAVAQARTTHHRTKIENLAPNTTYYFQVVARSLSGDEAKSIIVNAATGEATAGAASGDVRPSTSGLSMDGGYDVAVVRTKFGEIVFRFHETDAPKHAENFKKLAREGFFNGTTFHRVVPGFVIQGGDPNSRDSDRSNDGMGGPGYTIPAEVHHVHRRGSVAAARTGDQVNPQRRSSGSQFYICVAPAPNLDNQYTVFGEVVKGIEVVDRIVSVRRDRRDNPVDQVPMEVSILHIAPGESP